ncbi:mediator of RNA polymerase II transcription subunit 21 [Hydra vulgaris]|nr:mediator of RNA polymerase II transcription subunit 21 [Hydra vulgaris]
MCRVLCFTNCAPCKSEVGKYSNFPSFLLCQFLKLTKMADRLTQLQDALNQLAEHFCNSIGVIQQTAAVCTLQKNTNPKTEFDITQEGHAQLFATLISRTVKDIDYIIETLPSGKSNELQTKSLIQLEYENEVARKQLSQLVADGEELLSQIKNAISSVSNTVLSSKCTITKL